MPVICDSLPWEAFLGSALADGGDNSPNLCSFEPDRVTAVERCHNILGRVEDQWDTADENIDRNLGFPAWQASKGMARIFDFAQNSSRECSCKPSLSVG